jgi:hypothetical protein
LLDGLDEGFDEGFFEGNFDGLLDGLDEGLDEGDRVGERVSLTWVETLLRRVVHQCRPLHRLEYQELLR